METRNGPMIDLRYVKKLIEMIDDSSLDSIEISTEKGVKIRISKSPTQRGVQVTTPMTVPAVLPPGLMDTRVTPVAGMPAVATEAAAERPAAAAPASPMLEVKSPMVGTFY